MRVVVGERLGGPDVLKVTEQKAPRPGPGQVVVDVAAAGVNYMDIYQREGVGNYRTEPPFVPGAEGAGTVAAVGEDVTTLAVGDGVAWAGPGGSYAEQVVLPAKVRFLDADRDGLESRAPIYRLPVRRENNAAVPDGDPRQMP